MISDAKIYENNQGMKKIPEDYPQGLDKPIGITLTEEENLKWDKVYEQVLQKRVQRRKQRRVRDLLTFLNWFSASLFAAISVAERQVAVLQDLHALFTTRGQTKTKDHERRYPLRQNPFLDITPIPILSKNLEQIWASDLTTINEVVQERKFFIKKVKELIENMDIRRKIV